MLDFSVTFFITLINLGILFVILRAILFKPVTKFIEERARKIQSDRDEAERSRNEAEALTARLEERLKRAEDEAAEIIHAAREEARENAGAIIAGGRAEAEQLLAEARRRSQAEYQAALRLFQAEAAALVVRAAGKLARRNLAGLEEEAAALLEEIGALRPSTEGSGV
jgi:F-type H+-transporting ATPase subunit b